MKSKKKIKFENGRPTTQLKTKVNKQQQNDVKQLRLQDLSTLRTNYLKQQQLND